MTVREITENDVNNFDTLSNDHGMSLYRLLRRRRISMIAYNHRKAHGSHINTDCLKQNVKSGFSSDHVKSLS